MTRLRPLAALLLALAGCAAAPPPPARSAPPARPPDDAASLAEAGRLLADGVELDRAAALLAAVRQGPPRRDVLLGQLAELTGDDAAAVAAYDRALRAEPDDEVRLRRALALERLGRGDEAAEDLARLRAPAPGAGPEPRPERRLRPLKPSPR